MIVNLCQLTNISLMRLAVKFDEMKTDIHSVEANEEIRRCFNEINEELDTRMNELNEPMMDS